MISVKQSTELEQIGRVRPLAGKRVAMVLFAYYPSDPRVRRAAEALAGEGMAVDLICLKEGPEDPKYDSLNGVVIRRVPVSRRRSGMFVYVYEYLTFLLLSSAIILRRSFSRRYDLIYVHNMPDFLVLAGLIPQMLGAKIVLDLHDPMPELMQTIFNLPPSAGIVRFLKFVERRSIALADSVITVNRACLNLFASRSCSPEKITIVMNSPDEAIFRVGLPAPGKSVARGARPFVIMYHGSVVERNGLALAVEAFARVRERIPSAELRIYGEQNAFLERVMKSVRDRGLEECVHYLGNRPLEQIVEAIEACDVGIIPNQRNVFTELNTPVRIFEYVAMEKPVIAPDAGGIRDYFDESSLVFFELGSAEDLARKIEYVFNNPQEVAEIMRQARRIHRAHTWESEKSTLLGAVTGLMASSRQEN